MHPRRYIVLIPSLILLLWVLAVQQQHQLFTRAFAQSNPDTTNPATQLGPQDLPIDLVATSDSPVGTPKMVGTTVTLTATVASGSSAGLSYVWNFGDGQTAQGRVVQHSYAAEGMYSPFVIASNGAESKRANTLVQITPFFLTPIPEVPIKGLKATSDSPVIAGNPISLLATVVEGSNVTYAWNFGDGQTAIGPSVSHVYPVPGFYLVTLRAENRFGPVITTIQVEILDAPPKGLQIVHADPIVVNSVTFFTATVESGTNVQYQWSTSNGAIYNGSLFPYIFANTGSYEVRVRAWNAAGEIFASKRITVQDQPPGLIRLLDNGPKEINQPIDFSAQLQSNSPVVAYWQWGDNQVTEVRSRADQANSSIKDINATHSYAKPGRHIVTLVIYNLGGSITHEFIAYAGTSKPLQSFAITWTPSMSVFGNPITFSANYEPPFDSCTWDWGDGMSITGGPVITHTYAVADSYVVNAKCSITGNPQIRDADRIIHVGTTIFMPILAANGAFLSTPPTATPEVTPIGLATPDATLTPTATITLTPTTTLGSPVATTPIPSATAMATIVADPPTPTVTPTVTPMAIATPTDIPTPTATVEPVPTPTATIAPGGTIPQPTPLPTATELGGTIPQPPPP